MYHRLGYIVVYGEWQLREANLNRCELRLHGSSEKNGLK